MGLNKVLGFVDGKLHPYDLVWSHWLSCGVSALFNIAMFTLSLASLIVAMEGFSVYRWLYYTHWGMLVIVLYFFGAGILSILRLFSGCGDKRSFTFFTRVTYSCGVLGWSISILATIAWWGFQSDEIHYSAEAISYVLHGGNVVMCAIVLIFTQIQYRWSHAILFVFYHAIYVGVNFVVSFHLDAPVYSQITYRDLNTLWIFLVIAGALFVFFLVGWCLIKLRDRFGSNGQKGSTNGRTTAHSNSAGVELV